MPDTRSATDIGAIIESKFNAFKESLLEEFKAEFGTYIETEKKELTTFFESKKAELIDVSNQLEYSTSLAEIQKHVKKLQDENTAMKEDYGLLKRELDDLNQYVRRPNLRIFGVSVKRNENSVDVERVVKKIIEDHEIDIPDSSIDRAHRIGKVKKYDDGSELQPIIVRFTSFRDRTRFYKARKDIKDSCKYGVSLDLTKTRLSLLNEARDYVKDVPGIKFAYSDINCNLRVFTSNGRHLLFESMCDLQLIISKLR